MSDQWYIKTKNGKRGPYSKQQIQRYIDAGAIRPNAGLGDGEGNWVAAAAVEGLKFSDEVIAQLRAAIQAKNAKAAMSVVANAASGASANQTPDAGTLSGATEQATLELQQRSHILDERDRQLQERQDQLDSRATELEELAVSLQQRSDQDEATDQRVSDLELELAETQQNLDAIRDELAKQKQDYEDQLSDVAATLAQRDQELDDAQERSQSEDVDLEARRQAVALQESDLAVRTAEADQRESQLESSQEQIRLLEQSVAERSDELDQLQEELTAREQTIRQNEKALEEQDALLDQREVEVGNRHNEVIKWQSEMELLRSAAESAEAKTNQAEESIEQLQQTISDQQAELLSLREELKNKSQQFDEIRGGSVREEASEREQPTDVEAVSGSVSAELILSEKQKLLRAFAARQESLSQREADLMRRESELTRRELDIVVMSGPEPIQGDEPNPTTEPESDESILIDESGADDSSQETTESDGHEQPARAASSWEEALGQTQEGSQAYELADLDDPRYAPMPDEDSRSPNEQDQFFDDVLGSMAGGPPDAAATADVSREGQAGVSADAELDVVPKDRLPSEMLPSELPEYDGVLTGEESTAEPADLQVIEQDVTEPDTAEMEAFDRDPSESDATDHSGWYDFRRSAYEERFGPCSRYDVDQDHAMRVDVSVHQPGGTRDFVTLVTSGMSDYPIAMPNGQRSVRAELLLYVTHVDELAIEVLRNAAKIPYRRKHGLSIGTTGALSELGSQLSESHQQDCVYMLPVIESDSKPIPAKETIGSAIQLFWLVTITDAERKLIETSGIHKFLSLLEKNNHAVFFDLTRECYVKRKGWFRR